MGLGDLRQRVGRIQARVGSVPPVLALRSGETGPIELLRREIGPPRGLADMGEMLLLLPAEGPAGGNREGTATATATATGAVAAWGRSPTAQLLGEAARRAGRALSDLVGAADLLLRAMWATALRDGEMREVLAGAASVVRSSLPTHLYGVVATGTGTGAEALPPPPGRATGRSWRAPGPSRSPPGRWPQRSAWPPGPTFWGWHAPATAVPEWAGCGTP